MLIWVDPEDDELKRRDGIAANRIHIPSTRSFMEDVMPGTVEHEHEFTLPCFTCNDEPGSLCACGYCRLCGPRTDWYEIEREQIEFDRARKRR